jgi:hypothetical protein
MQERRALGHRGHCLQQLAGRGVPGSHLRGCCLHLCLLLPAGTRLGGTLLLRIIRLLLVLLLVLLLLIVPLLLLWLLVLVLLRLAIPLLRLAINLLLVVVSLLLLGRLRLLLLRRRQASQHLLHMMLLVCRQCLQQLLHLLLVLGRDVLENLLQRALPLHRRHLHLHLLLPLVSSICLLLPAAHLLLLVELLMGCLMVCLLLLRRLLGLCLLPAASAGGGGGRALPLHLLHPLCSGGLPRGRRRLLLLTRSRCQLAIQRQARCLPGVLKVAARSLCILGHHVLGAVILQAGKAVQAGKGGGGEEGHI